jgi:hypothetical protein
MSGMFRSSMMRGAPGLSPIGLSLSGRAPEQRFILGGSHVSHRIKEGLYHRARVQHGFTKTYSYKKCAALTLCLFSLSTTEGLTRCCTVWLVLLLCSMVQDVSFVAAERA